MGRKDYGDKNTKLRGAGKVAKRQAGFDKTGKLEFIKSYKCCKSLQVFFYVSNQ